MPSLSATLARVPGAINLDVDELDGSDILSLDTFGPRSAQTTLDKLAEFFGVVPFVLSARVVTTNAQAVVTETDVLLLINKTIASATSLLLPTPTLGRGLLIKDMKGDAETNPITLDAGSGKLINGLQTLVMDGNYGATWLVGMSSTQWGTLI